MLLFSKMSTNEQEYLEKYVEEISLILELTC